jgi:hypothetical protein
VPTPSEAIDAAIQEVSTARSAVLKVKTVQIRCVDVIGPLKATALSWFNTHRPAILAGAPRVELDDANRYYTIILESTAKSAARQTYLDALQDAKAALIKVRTAVLSLPATSAVSNVDDLAPDFSPLAGNQEMRDILTRRWHECCKCVKADAHLAAIVMMGGLLEALFVARANKLAVKTRLVNAASAPKDKATGKTQNYQDWMLDSYIKVGHELGWITESAKDVADILKEYRNYIHPEKERRHGITLGFNDSSIFWQVTKALVRQLLMSAGSP